MIMEELPGLFAICLLGYLLCAECTENQILVTQSPMLVVYDNAVNLTCTYTHNIFSKEFRASLYKGVDSSVEVCLVSGNYSHHVRSQSNTGFNCDVKLGNETVTFYLWNLYANQTDIYFCKIEVMYPPPYIDNQKSNGTIIHVKETHPCPVTKSECPETFWLLVVVGVLSFYSFLVTVLFCVFWTKNKKKRLLQNDYMNMTPRRRVGPNGKYYQPYAPARDFAAYRS